MIVNDGADGAKSLIRLQGAIGKGDAASLDSALARVRQVATSTINGVPFITIELDSPGGDVVEALDIGRIIYRNFLMTLVRPGRECVSACVFVLMAGAVHTPADGARIGLHRPLLVSWSHIGAEEAHARYNGLMAYLREYFQQLGVDDAAFEMMMRTDSDGMRYFSPAEMDRLHLRGEDPAWEKFYHSTWAAANAPAGPMEAKQVAATLPEMPKVDEIYRSVVFMPGAYHAGVDYFAGVDLPNAKFAWASMDDGEWRPLWISGDLAGTIWALMAAIWSWLRPVWWFIAILAFEILRARPWPGDPGSRHGAEAWRLDGLVSRASTGATGQA